MITAQKIVTGLREFHSTDGYTRYTFGILLTDGVKWLCNAAECYWLIDAIGSYQNTPAVKNDRLLQEFQFWTLKVAADKSAVLILERDTDDVALTQKIEYTDFPLSEIKLYYSPVDKVLLLPSEY
jgi:hypothetical protein